MNKLNHYLVGAGLAALVLLGVAALPPGVTGKFIYQYAENPVPPLTYWILEDPGDGNYRKSSLAEIQAVIGGSSTNYITSVSNSIYLSFTAADTVVSNSLYLYVTGGFLPISNGNGTNENFWGTTYFDTLLANLFYATNFFTLKTNYSVLGTDGNGQFINGATGGSPYASNILHGGTILLSAVDYTPATNNDAIIGTGATNDDTYFGGRATNNDTVIGTGATNNDTVVSNGVINTIIGGQTGFLEVPIMTNQWSGATNTLSFGTEDYFYSSATACSVTGFTSKPTTNAANAILTLFNSSGSNWVLTIPTTVLTATGVRGSVTVTNGQYLIAWFRYHPGAGITNLVQCPNY